MPGPGCAGLTQISCESGLRKLKTPGVCFTGFLIIMEMPSDMKGLVKSMTRSRSAVIVRGAMAMSASCKPPQASQSARQSTNRVTMCKASPVPPSLFRTYLAHQFTHHAIPAARCKLILGAAVAVLHNTQLNCRGTIVMTTSISLTLAHTLTFNAQPGGQQLGQILAISLKAFVANQMFHG